MGFNPSTAPLVSVNVPGLLPKMELAKSVPILLSVYSPLPPTFSASVFVTVVFALKVTPALLVMVKLLTMAGRPSVTWAAVPLKV